MRRNYPINVTAVVEQPYLLTFNETKTTYQITAEQLRGYLAEYPVISASKYRITLMGHNTGRASARTTIRPFGRIASFTIAK